MAGPFIDYDPVPKIPATIQTKYALMRTVTANDTALTSKTKYWDAIQSTWYSLPSRLNHAEIAVLAYGDGTGDGDPNAGVCTIAVYAARWGCSAVPVFHGKVTIGDLEASCAPDTLAQYHAGALDVNESYKYAKSIDPNSFGDCWPSGVTVSPKTGNADDLGRISFDCTGYYKLWVIVTGKSGWTSLKVLVAGY